MTDREAIKIANSIRFVDGACPYCISDICEKLNDNFMYDLNENNQEFPYRWIVIEGEIRIFKNELLLEAIEIHPYR